MKKLLCSQHTLKLQDKDQSFNLNLFKCKKNYIVRNHDKFRKLHCAKSE